jgi:glycosyltransferase involved in cell wall biosynthesis
MVSQWYDPELGSAALPGIISRSLARQGHEVEVLTGFPNYPQGQLYPGYRLKPYQRELIDGVTVHRAPLFPSHDTRALTRVANYLSFSAGSSAVGVARLAGVDAVLVHGTPATAAAPALLLKRLRGVPFVFHVQDLWPDTVVSSGFLDEGRAKRVEAALHRFCDTVYRHAHAVAVTSPGMADRVAARGVPDNKIHFVPNWADEVSFRPVAKDPAVAARLGATRPFTVMYAGVFGEFQALDTLIDAAARLRDRRDIGFTLVGGGVAEASLRAQVARLGLDNVTFAPLQPFSEMADVLAAGDAQVISLRDRPLSERTLPSKLQGTLAAGRPIIGALAGDAAAVVRQSKAGPVVQPGSVAEMAQAVTDLADAPGDHVAALGAQARRFYLDTFSEAVNAGRLTALLASAAASRGRR